MADEVNLLFYKGIPASLHKKVKRKIPEAHLKATSAPPINSILGFLRDKFDVDDIDNDPYDMDFCTNSDLDLSDDNLEPRYKHSHMHRKKVTEQVPPGPTAKPQVPSTLDALAKQLNDEIREAVKNEQEAVLQELTAMTPTPAYRTWNDDPQTSSSWTAKFAGIELDGANMLTEGVYTISSSSPWPPVCSAPLVGPMEMCHDFVTPKKVLPNPPCTMHPSFSPQHRPSPRN
jgi:hypothetical protein